MRPMALLGKKEAHMRKLMRAAIVIATFFAATFVAQAADKLGKQIVGKSFCYASGHKVTFNSNRTMSNDFGKQRNWSIDKNGTSIIYSGPGFIRIVPTTIDASGVLNETDPTSGQTRTASPC